MLSYRRIAVFAVVILLCFYYIAFDRLFATLNVASSISKPLSRHANQGWLIFTRKILKISELSFSKLFSANNTFSSDQRVKLSSAAVISLNDTNTLRSSRNILILHWPPCRYDAFCRGHVTVFPEDETSGNAIGLKTSDGANENEDHKHEAAATCNFTSDRAALDKADFVIFHTMSISLLSNLTIINAYLPPKRKLINSSSFP
jgi:hypothetical protein